MEWRLENSEVWHEYKKGDHNYLRDLDIFFIRDLRVSSSIIRKCTYIGGERKFYSLSEDENVLFESSLSTIENSIPYKLINGHPKPRLLEAPKIRKETPPNITITSLKLMIEKISRVKGEPTKDIYYKIYTESFGKERYKEMKCKAYWKGKTVIKTLTKEQKTTVYNTIIKYYGDLF